MTAMRLIRHLKVKAIGREKKRLHSNHICIVNSQAMLQGGGGGGGGGRGLQKKHTIDASVKGKNLEMPMQHEN